MFKKILVPLDGSELSESVFPWVRALVEHFKPGVEVMLLRSFEPPTTVYLLPELSLPTTNILSDDYLSGRIIEYLAEQSKKVPDCEVDTRVTLGDAASEILNYGEDADLIVMGSHGRGGIGKWLLGSVATKVVRGATIPILVVGARVLEDNLLHQGHLNKILVPVDGSEPAKRAFHFACELARKMTATLEIYTSVSQVEIQHQFALETNRAGVEYFQDYQASLIEGIDDLEISCTVRETFGRAGIAGFAEEVGADLIAMGSHGGSGLERWLLGSQTEKTLQLAKCPILITH